MTTTGNDIQSHHKATNSSLSHIDDKFNKYGFLETIDVANLQFMQHFIGTQMFLSFIQDIMDADNGKILPDILLFQACHQVYSNRDTGIWMKRKYLEDHIVNKLPSKVSSL